jgi:hypothetical protein
MFGKSSVTLTPSRDEPADGVKVESSNGTSYFVFLTKNGKASALAPYAARDLAASLVVAADEADSRMTDDARSELASWNTGK